MLEAMERVDESDPALSSTDAPEPNENGSPAEFIAALRTLKAWSGLAYRQLEGKAAARGDVLPSSTIATTLGRDTLPRERFVTAFTQACGLDEDRARKWNDARRHIAMREKYPNGAAAEGVPADPPEAAGGRARVRWKPRLSRWRLAIGLVAASGVGIAGTLGVQGALDLLTHAHYNTVAAAENPVAGLALPDVGSWAQIQPARTPEFCIAEGRDRTLRHPTVIAAQRLCVGAVPSRVYLDPIDEGTVQIQWHHPKAGIGCLTVLVDGPGDDLIEPRDDCADDNPTQQFRIEPTGPVSAARFRIRTTATGYCLALRNQDTSEGTEIVQGRCSGARDQEFLINLIPPA